MTNPLAPLHAFTVVFGTDFSNIAARGPKGNDGTNGNTILSGDGPPIASIGNDGDFYIDTANDQNGARLMYGPKAAGAWPAGVDLIGYPGTNGAAGAGAKVRIGTVTTGAPGSTAVVENVGTINDAVFNITLPRGDAGVDGVDGAAATIAVGTVTTGAAGSQAQVVNVGSSTAATLNFTIPQGAKGDPGTGDVSKAAVNVFTKNQSVAPVAANAASITPDASTTNNFKVLLGQNTTIANPSNLTDGMVLNFRIRQDATGGRTVSFGTLFKWSGGTVPTFPTAANAVSLVSAYYDADSGFLLCNAAVDIK